MVEVPAVLRKYGAEFTTVGARPCSRNAPFSKSLMIVAVLCSNLLCEDAEEHIFGRGLELLAYLK